MEGFPYISLLGHQVNKANFQTWSEKKEISLGNKGRLTRFAEGFSEGFSEGEGQEHIG